MIEGTKDLYACMNGSCSHDKSILANTACSNAHHIAKLYAADPTDLLDRPDVAALLFTVPSSAYSSKLEDYGSLDTLVSEKQLTSMVIEGAAGDSSPEFTPSFGFSCLFLAEAIGAFVCDPVIFKLVDRPESPAALARSEWLFCDASNIRGAARSKVVLSAILSISTRGFPHRALELVAFLVNAYATARPCEPPAQDAQLGNFGAKGTEFVCEYLRGEVAKSVFVEGLLDIAPFLSPWPVTDAKRGDLAGTVNHMHDDYIASVKALPEKSPEARAADLQYIKGVAETLACGCGVTWVHCPVKLNVASATKTLVLSACAAESIGTGGCSMAFPPPVLN